MSTDTWSTSKLALSCAPVGGATSSSPRTGPAGATESELPLDTWAEVIDANPQLTTLQPDVEAFLVRSRSKGGGTECYVVPIDVCYELVGHLRTLWRGFDGGKEANDKLDSFFESVRTRAQ